MVDYGIRRETTDTSGEGTLERTGYTTELRAFGFARSRISSTAARIRVLLAIYGIVFGVIGGLQLDHAIQGASAGLSSYRQAQMTASIDLLDRHGPPLTGLSNDGTSSYYPLATDDDRGGFIYVPLIGYELGSHNLDAILKWLFIAFFVPMLIVYPLVLYEVTGSLIAAIAAPLILVSHSAFFRASGIFWVPAWANLFLLPLLLLIAKRWKQSRLWLLVALAVVASFASSMRANAGLGFLIGALIVIFARMPRWRLRVASGVLIVLAYLSIGTFAMHAVQLQRDDVVRSDFTSPYPNGHPFWHNAYMGLGYVKNPYGIRMRDAVARTAARRHDPGAVFPTKRYERALRTVYYHFVEQHPGFVLHEYALKGAAVLASAIDWFPVGVILAPLALLFGNRGRRRERRFQCLLIAGAGIVGAATGIIVAPDRAAETQSGWYSFVLLLWVLSIGWIARAPEAFAARTARHMSTRFISALDESGFPPPSTWKRIALSLARATLRRVVVRAGRGAARVVGSFQVAGAWHSWSSRLARGAVLGLVVGAAFFLNSSIDAAALTEHAADAANQADLVPRAAIKGPIVETWTFAGLPRGWWGPGIHRLSSGAGKLVLRTTRGKYAYQLSSPARLLEPGSYVVLVDGRVLSGGLQLGVVDDRANAFIDRSFYWSGQSFPQKSRMAVPFELATPTRARFILSNFSAAGHSSLWSLHSLALIRQPAGCRLNDPLAWFSPTTKVALP